MKLPLSTILVPLLFCMLTKADLSAQDTIHITVHSVYVNNQVILRWAPTDLPSWRYSNVHGYSIERKMLRRHGEMLSTEDSNSSYVLLADTLKLIPESEWEAMSDTSDMAGIAAGTIYGDSLDLLPVEGGGLVQIYNKARETENRFGFSLFAADQDIHIAEAMGLAFVDQGVEANIEYVYFIKALGSAATSGGFISVTTSNASALPTPTGLHAYAADKTALIQWNRNDKIFSSFSIERAVGTSGTFVKMNESPLMFATTTGGENDPMSFTDSLADNTTIHVYRVRGLTPFGIWSPYSDTIQVKGKPVALSFLFSINNVSEVNTGDLTLTWEFPTSLETQIGGFEVYRSDKIDGVYTKINSHPITAASRTYEDTSPLPANYYTIKTSDANGYVYQTFPSLGQPKDDSPPDQPVISIGEASPTGVVTLSWERGKPDVTGFRVYMSNMSKGDFAQVTETVLTDTFFRYQLDMNTLSEEVYFGLTALDIRQNQSIMSEPFLVMRPDVMPPAPPVIIEAEATATGVGFYWTLSPSTDVVGYTLERKEIGMRSWTAVANFTPESIDPRYEDHSASARTRYEYRLVATDDAGLKSSSRMVKISPIDNGMRHAIQNFTGSYQEKYVALQWEYMTDPDLIGFEVFRSIQDSTHQRAYAFVKIPSGQTGVPNLISTATLSGNEWNCTFEDWDMDFSLTQRSTFISSPNLTQNTNTSIPAPGNPVATLSTYSVSNPNNLYGQSSSTPTTLYYWVMAKYADGGYSPMAGALEVKLE